MTGRRPKDDRKTATDPRVLETIQELGRIGGKTRANVYEDRVSGWLLRPIRTLLETRDSHFAALSLALSYFEDWAQYRYGEDSRGQSRELFMRAVKHVVPVVERHVPDRGDDLATELAMLYDEARCGASISISAQRATLEISAFVIDPAAFVDDIEYHFERYVAGLRDPKNADLRDNSTRTWERKHVGGPLHVPLGFPPGFGPSSSLGLG
jgi:hypothetical protein